MTNYTRLMLLGAAATLAACGGREGATTDTGASAAAPPSSVAAAGGEQTPDAGGKIIEVEMLTDEKGNNVFRPADFEAHRGDVVRYKLVSGVHNVHFVADSNRGVPNLPPASQMLQLPGQTHDVKVTLPPGKYFYQCDPHALLGMVGRMEVEDEN